MKLKRSALSFLVAVLIMAVIGMAGAEHYEQVWIWVGVYNLMRWHERTQL